MIDVVGGSILAYILYWFQWTFKDQFDGLFTAETIIPSKCILSLDMEWNSDRSVCYHVALIAAAICLALVGLQYVNNHVDGCPIR